MEELEKVSLLFDALLIEVCVAGTCHIQQEEGVHQPELNRTDCLIKAMFSQRERERERERERKREREIDRERTVLMSCPRCTGCGVQLQVA